MNSLQPQIMLDIETLGNKPNSVITSLGAIKFNLYNGVFDEFYIKINPKSCIQYGLEMDIETVVWWACQAKEAQKEIFLEGSPVKECLIAFSEWFGNASLPLWGNGVGFDNVIVSNAYDKVGLSTLKPWKFSDDRCYRTVKNLYPQILIEKNGVAHNALDDARNQTLHLIKILNLINE